MTGTDSVAATVAGCGVKLTVRLHVEEGASAEQLDATVKLGSDTSGVPKDSVDAPVLVNVMVCVVAMLPGTSLKTRAVELIASPGSSEPKPLSAAVTVPPEVTMVSVPLRSPVAAGAKATCTKQLAVAASVPVQEAPPVLLAMIAKSPLVLTLCTVTGTAVLSTFASVKVAGADVLFTGTGPKPWVTGVSSRPCTGSAVAVTVSRYGLPPATVDRDSDALCAPAVCARNCTPSQQLLHAEVAVAPKLVGGNAGCALLFTSATPNAALLLVTVSEVSDCCTWYHAVSGSPASVWPRASVPLLAGRRAALVPLSATVLGAKPLPAVTLSRPSRGPGCEGAKPTSTVQEAPPASVAGQPLVSVKSPLTFSVSAKASPPVLLTTTLCVLLETPVTTTGVANVSELAESPRLGFATLPVTPAEGLDSPVSSTLTP